MKITYFPIFVYLFINTCFANDTIIFCHTNGELTCHLDDQRNTFISILITTKDFMIPEEDLVIFSQIINQKIKQLVQKSPWKDIETMLSFDGYGIHITSIGQYNDVCNYLYELGIILGSAITDIEESIFLQAKTEGIKKVIFLKSLPPSMRRNSLNTVYLAGSILSKIQINQDQMIITGREEQVCKPNPYIKYKTSNQEINLEEIIELKNLIKNKKIEAFSNSLYIFKHHAYIKGSANAPKYKERNIQFMWDIFCSTVTKV